MNYPKTPMKFITMKITQNVMLAVAVFLCILTGSAQNTDGGATELLKKVATQYQAYSSIQFQYTLKATKENKTLSTQTGSFAVKGDKYHTTFNGQTFLCDGNTIWNYQKATHEVSIYVYDPEDDENIMNPQRILKNWNTHFRAKYIRDEVIRNTAVAIIDLTPKTGQSYYKIRLYIQKGNHRIQRMAMYDKDNTVYTYYIEQFKTNVALSDSYFVFDKTKYPGVIENDMR